MIVCICRNISDQDYSEEDLRKRLMEDDYNCGQCQLKYILEAQREADMREIEELESIGAMDDSEAVVKDYIEDYVNNTGE